MTLKQITFRNFQKWTKLTVPLSPGVNVFWGDTDAGKSSVLRGLKWIATNSPDGDSFITHGKTFARVELEFDSHTATRRRGKGANSYELNGSEYVSFGRGKVPDDIITLLNISPLSFQGQHDPPHLLSLPPGEVSRELNSVVNLDLIDRTLANAATQVRKAQATETVCRERLETAKVKLGKLGWVQEAGKLWKQIEGLRMEAEEHARKAMLGATILADVAKATQRADWLSNAILGTKAVIEAGETALKQRERVERIHYFVGKLGSVRKKRSKPIPDLKAVLELERLQGEVGRQGERVERLREMVGELERLGKARWEANKGLERLRALLEKELKGKACPVCGNPPR